MSDAALASRAKFEALDAEWHDVAHSADPEREYVRLADEWRAVEWRSGGRTLLDALGLQFNEVAMCRGLAWLLDPQGGHRMGHHPLLAFLREFNVDVAVGEQVSIRVEESIADSRADIVLRVGGRTVVIEAKILAGEQPRQADRIHEHWSGESTTLVFLTRTGYLPRTARASDGLWSACTWREISQLMQRITQQEELDPSPGAREFIESIGAL